MKWSAEGLALTVKGGSSSSLWDCCRHGSTDELVKVLVQVTAADLSRKDREGRSGLYLACDAGFTEVVKVLLAQPGIDPSTADITGWTPLLMTTKRRSIESVKVLLNHFDISVNQASSDGHTPLSIGIYLS
jgi:ankyrin repeat protein